MGPIEVQITVAGEQTTAQGTEASDVLLAVAVALLPYPAAHPSDPGELLHLVNALDSQHNEMIGHLRERGYSASAP